MPSLKKGEVVLVDRIPECDFCGRPGPYDFKTTDRFWANGCPRHYLLWRVYPDLGVGKAQLWVTEDQVTES